MIMKKQTPQTLYIASELFYNENALDKAIRQLPGITKEYIDKMDLMQVFFYPVNNLLEAFATALFERGKLIYAGFNINKSTGTIGKERITNNLADILELNIPEFDTRAFIHKSLNEYFNDRDTANKEYKKSEYKRHKPFMTVLLELESSVKSKVFDAGADVIKNINGLSPQNNPCDFGSDINKTTLKASIGANILPFHQCIISYDDMNQALDNLSRDNQISLQAFYFSNMYSEYQNEIDKINRYKKSDRTKYQKVLRAKNNALDSLIDSICDTQYKSNHVVKV